MNSSLPTTVHLVGSVALDSVEDVFRTTGNLLGRRLKRVPDGEPGGRRLWVSWQYPLLRANAYLKLDPAPTRQSLSPLLCLADATASQDIRFGELGYAREAPSSYADFLTAKQRGELPVGLRFQVCLPTPMAVIYAMCSPNDLPVIEATYERAMLDEVRAIARAIPHRDLSIQWDLSIETLLWDGQLSSRYPSRGTSKSEILERLTRLAASIPSDIELGFHFCYGDLDAKHFVEPVDAGAMVEFANAVAHAVHRPIAFMHMPVPIERTDDAYFRPFADLKIPDGTELYLGVVHLADGTEGIRRRVFAARKYVADFGIATECGMGRLRPDVVLNLITLHAAASAEPPPG